YSKEIIQEDTAEQKSCDTSTEDSRADLIHRCTDLIQDHESYDCQKHGSRGGNIRRIHSESTPEDDQCTHGKRIRDSCRESSQEYIRKEMSLDPVLIRLKCQEERRHTNRKHTDQ